MDFVASTFGWHIVFVVFRHGIPRAFSWWIGNAALIVLTVVMAERLCQELEMQDIPSGMAGDLLPNPQKSSKMDQNENDKKGLLRSSIATDLV